MTNPDGLDEKGLEAAETAWRASVSATCKLMLRDAIRAYLSALPSPAGELEVVAWRWPEPQTEGGFLHSVTNVEPPCSGWEPLVRQPDALSLISTLRGEKEGLAAQLKDWQNGCSNSIRAHGEALDRLEAAEQQVQRLREALAPFAAVADEYDDSDDDHHEVWIDAGPEKVIRGSFALRNYRAARSALSNQEGGE